MTSPRLKLDFVDPEVRKRLDRDGFAACEVLEPEDLPVLLEVYRTILPQLESAFHRTMLSPNIAYRRRVFEVAKAILGRRLGRAIRGGRVAMAQLVIKRAASTDSDCAPHQDWSFVDERSCEAVNLWCPLTEIHDDSGPLLVAPGSHRMSSRPRPNCAPADWTSPFSELFPALLAKHMTAMHRSTVYHSGLVHASAPNLRSNDRVALLAIVVPEPAPLRHFWRKDSDTVEVFDVDEEFYVSEAAPGARPEGRRMLEERRLPQRTHQFTEADYLRVLPRAGPAHQKRRHA